jgi:hypothetical protein
MGSMSTSDAAPLPRLGEVFFDVRSTSRSLRISWYADTGVAVLSIWQGGTCTGSFRLPMGDLPRLIETLQRGPDGWAGPGEEHPPHPGAGYAPQADRAEQARATAAPGHEPYPASPGSLHYLNGAAAAHYQAGAAGGYPDGAPAGYPGGTTAARYPEETTTAGYPDGTTAGYPDGASAARYPDSATAGYPDGTTAGYPDGTTAAHYPEGTTARYPDSAAAGYLEETTARYPDGTTAGHQDGASAARYPEDTTVGYPDDAARPGYRDEPMRPPHQDQPRPADYPAGLTHPDSPAAPPGGPYAGSPYPSSPYASGRYPTDPYSNGAQPRDYSAGPSGIDYRQPPPLPPYGHRPPGRADEDPPPDWDSRVVVPGGHELEPLPESFPYGLPPGSK